MELHGEDRTQFYYNFEQRGVGIARSYTRRLVQIREIMSQKHSYFLNIFLAFLGVVIFQC